MSKPSLVSNRVRAFFGATVVVVGLWLVAVVSVNVFAPAPAFGDRARRFVEGVEKLKGVKRIVLRTSPPKNGPIVGFLHNTGGNPLDLTAWPTVAQIMILIILAALVVAGLDRLRRKNRHRRRLRTA